jgi:hypothetical protein
MVEYQGRLYRQNSKEHIWEMSVFQVGVLLISCHSVFSVLLHRIRTLLCAGTGLSFIPNSLRTAPTYYLNLLAASVSDYVYISFKITIETDTVTCRIFFSSVLTVGLRRL